MNKVISIAEALSSKAKVIADLQREHAKLESAARVLRDGGYSADQIGFMLIEENPAAAPDERGAAHALLDAHTVDEVAMWFDLLRDLAIRLGDELSSGEPANLAWSIQKLAEKFGDDARCIVSALIAEAKGGAA